MAIKKKEAAQVVEVEGIKVAVMVDPADDYELTELMLERMDPDADNRSRSEATIKAYKIILGEDYQRVKDELRAKHGGRLTNGEMIAFMNELTKKVSALKNSQA